MVSIGGESSEEVVNFAKISIEALDYGEKIEKSNSIQLKLWKFSLWMSFSAKVKCIFSVTYLDGGGGGVWRIWTHLTTEKF